VAAATEEAACDAEVNAVKAFKDRHGSARPSGFRRELAEIFEKAGIKGDLFSCFRAHQQITSIKDSELGKHIPFFHRTLNIQTDDYEENVTPFREAIDEAFEKRIDAMNAVFEIVPTTLAGFRAKIDFAMSVQHVRAAFTDNNEDLGNFLDTLYESARLIAVQS
jgi:hypothetical protein